MPRIPIALLFLGAFALSAPAQSAQILHYGGTALPPGTATDTAFCKGQPHIEIHGTHCTVEIPPHLGARIVAAMRRATLRGQLARPRLLSSGADLNDGPSRPARPARPEQPVPPRSGFGPPRRGHASRR